MNNNKGIWVVIVVVILLVVAIAVIITPNFFPKLNVSPTKSSQPQSALPRTEVENLNPSDNSTDFPDITELPMPTSATVIKVFRTTVSEVGRTGVQVTKVLESPKSLNENFTYYKNLLQDKQYGWIIMNNGASPLNPLPQPNIKAIIAQNKEGTLNILMIFSPDTKKTTINLYFLLNPSPEPK